MKPIIVALQGKGPAALLKRIGSIGKRYGLTAAKMDNALSLMAGLLETYDCRATLPITSVALARNGPVIKKYQARGIEFAVHGYRHIDHSLLSLPEQDAQLGQAREIFQTEGIEFAGFRCPYLRWNPATLAALEQNQFLYDSSNSLFWEIEERHKTERYYRALEFYGAAPAADYLALPALKPGSELVRIPYCLPDDESLVERLMWDSPEEMDQVWTRLFQQIHRQGELFTLGLHPERTGECATGLATTLQAVHALGEAVWPARLSEIATWWKARTASQVQLSPLPEKRFQLAVEGPAGVTLLLRNLATPSPTAPWFAGYRRALELPAILQCDRKPIIGLSPAAEPALTSFLQQQGYIIEVSPDAAAYSFYLDRRTISPAEQRALVQQIETAPFPLARLGRWPHGALSAFNVTGDIDALTLWDYTQRVWEV
jgi:peptidoglycan/xylan/chitin deacetylase (PgdA/CDA1 family)